MAPAIERAFQILDLVSRSSEPMGASAVARRLRIAKSSAHGLLRSLSEVGALEEVRQRYRLGPLVPRIAAAAELRRRWRPVLERLAVESGETAFLGQPRGGRVAVVDEVLGIGAPVISAPAGSFVPASAGALGKVLGGARSALDLGEYLEGVHAAAAGVPGGVVWVAGFASRLDAGRAAELRLRLEELV